MVPASSSRVPGSKLCLQGGWGSGMAGSVGWVDAIARAHPPTLLLKPPCNCMEFWP